MLVCLVACLFKSQMEVESSNPWIWLQMATKTQSRLRGRNSISSFAHIPSICCYFSGPFYGTLSGSYTRSREAVIQIRILQWGAGFASYSLTYCIMRLIAGDISLDNWLVVHWIVLKCSLQKQLYYQFWSNLEVGLGNLNTKPRFPNPH